MAASLNTWMVSRRKFNERRQTRQLFLEYDMKKSIIFAAILFLTLAGPIMAQAPEAGGKEKQSAAAVPKRKAFTITGKITKAPYAYLIRRQKPTERYAIMNPNPEVLDSLVKSGKIVTIEAIRVMGDNVRIEKIDGKDYKGLKRMQEMPKK